jgi:transcriptional regulator of arginine metabolism
MTISSAKRYRQDVVRRLLAETNLHSQEELVEALDAAGVQTTQATVSRDLDELGAIKVRGVAGGLVYRVSADTAPATARDRLADTITQFVVRIESSANIAVLRTPPACAQPVASVIDLSELDEVMATMAGDDTVLVVAREPHTGKDLADHFTALLMETT